MSRATSKSHESKLPRAEIWLAFGIAVIWALLLRAGPLDLPYFWDEADVYAPGAHWLAENSLDFRPGVFPDDYSRGHPPLLYVMAGMSFRAFGPEPLIGHLVVLPFAALALAATYLLGMCLWGRRTGLAAATLLGITPLFASISAMLLPEVTLTALAALAMLLFVRGRFIALAFCGSAMVLLKETGLFVPLALAGAVGLEALWHRQLLKAVVWKRLALILVPIPVLAGFFVWQKLGAGYFIFPHHQNLFWARDAGFSDLLTVAPSTLVWHGRWLVVGAGGLLALLAIRRKDLRPGLQGLRGTEPYSPDKTPGATSLALAVALLFLGNTIFFTQMFWLHRYALPVHPGILLLATAALLSDTGKFKNKLWRFARWVPVLGALLWAATGLKTATAANEAELNFSYADVIATHLQAYRAMEQNPMNPEGVVLSSWPMTIELRHPYLGYVSSSQKSVHIDQLRRDDGKQPAIERVLLPLQSRHTAALRAKAAALGMRRQGRYQVGKAQALELMAP